MFDIIFGHNSRRCDGVSRRDFLRLMGASVALVTLDPARIDRLQEAGPVIDAYLAGLGCPPAA